LQHAAGSKQHMQQEEITCTEVETIAAGLDQAGLAAHHQASHHPHPHPHFTHHPHHYHQQQQQESKSKSISANIGISWLVIQQRGSVGYK